MKESLHPWGEVFVKADKGCEKVFLFGHHSQSTKVSLQPESEDNLLDDGFCDFAFGSAQNDRLGGIRGKSDLFISEIPTIKEYGALCISF